MCFQTQIAFKMVMRQFFQPLNAKKLIIWLLNQEETLNVIDARYTISTKKDGHATRYIQDIIPGGSPKKSLNIAMKMSAFSAFHLNAIQVKLIFQ